MCPPYHTPHLPPHLPHTCRYNAGDQAQVLWGAGIRDQTQLSALVSSLNAEGMPTVDISRMEAAQLHLRWGMRRKVVTPGSCSC